MLWWVRMSAGEYTKEICEARKFCKLKNCEDLQNRWINISNCTCRGCLLRSEDKVCEFSGEAYNTDNECLMDK